MAATLEIIMGYITPAADAATSLVVNHDSEKLRLALVDQNAQAESTVSSGNLWGQAYGERSAYATDYRPTTFGLYAQYPGRGPTFGWLRQVSGRLS